MMLLPLLLGRSVTNPNDIFESFNDYSVTLGQNLCKESPSTKNKPTNYLIYPATEINHFPFLPPL